MSDDDDEKKKQQKVSESLTPSLYLKGCDEDSHLGVSGSLWKMARLQLYVMITTCLEGCSTV